ncbi:dienelactone hydrolase family protein [Rhizobium sp. L1K21]|uniref:dienelactone hydrolase family protein n=1 Tax=Rhizobium sp. L1K21 TaxID=2954933 RepID=UPI00209313D0|nr:dienelactone hydrolase family protein [Rhizobium sp. L1K21]MCO6188102.1 dienelactone hydrolase family protein [Rhizobium sp. L1K21]
MLRTEWIDITAKDGFTTKMYLAKPDGAPKGAVMVLQEIFGVNDHIRSVCDRLAALGYVAGAPSLFDRLQPGYEHGYEAEDVAAGRAMMETFDFAAAESDMTAAIEALKPFGKVSTIGFCLGGSLSYLMATINSDLVAASCYYGGRIGVYADTKPLCPTILHYGETDQSIPLEKVEEVRAKRPDLPIYIYPAGHGFNCDARASYEPESAKLAWQRTMELIDTASQS